MVLYVSAASRVARHHPSIVCAPVMPTHMPVGILLHHQNPKPEREANVRRTRGPLAWEEDSSSLVWMRYRSSLP